MISLIIKDVVLYDITITTEKCLAEMLIGIFIYLAIFVQARFSADLPFALVLTPAPQTE